MKILLASLLCLVLGASESFALSGGPPYPGSANTVGTFAGVVEPSVTANGCGSNLIGVFSIGVPQTGISTGTFVMFAQGRVYSGTVRGIADSGRASLRAILNATLNYTVTRTDPFTGTTSTTAVTATANGNLNAQISTPSRSLGTASTRLRGTGAIEISQGQLNSDLTPHLTCSTNLDVIGFKQSDTAPTVTAP